MSAVKGGLFGSLLGGAAGLGAGVAVAALTGIEEPVEALQDFYLDIINNRQGTEGLDPELAEMLKTAKETITNMDPKLPIEEFANKFDAAFQPVEDAINNKELAEFTTEEANKFKKLDDILTALSEDTGLGEKTMEQLQNSDKFTRNAIAGGGALAGGAVGAVKGGGYAARERARRAASEQSPGQTVG